MESELLFQLLFATHKFGHFSQFGKIAPMSISFWLNNLLNVVSIFSLLFIGKTMLTAIDNCPMRVVRQIIIRTAEATTRTDAPLQMQVIRRIMEDIYGGTWGVLIIRDPELISISVHWTFPDHRHKDGSAAFCLYVENGWQYNVFKTGDIDTEDRLTIEQVVEQMNRLMNSTASRASKRGIGEDKGATNSFLNSLIIDKNRK